MGTHVACCINKIRAVQNLDVILTPHDGRLRWISNQLSATKVADNSFTYSKFTAIFHCVTSMWHPYTVRTKQFLVNLLLILYLLDRNIKEVTGTWDSNMLRPVKNVGSIRISIYKMMRSTQTWGSIQSVQYLLFRLM